MLRLIPTALISTLTACGGYTWPDPDGGPSIDSVDLNCEGADVTGEIVVSDLNSVLNLTIAVEAADRGQADPDLWFPELTVDNTETVTLWSVDEHLDCDQAWTLQLTATNLFGQQSDTTVTLGGSASDPPVAAVTPPLRQRRRRLRAHPGRGQPRWCDRGVVWRRRGRHPIGR